MKRSLSALVVLASLVLTASVVAQDQPDAPPPPPPPPANEADVASIGAITAAVYECISGEKGEPRQWTRFRSLFYPGAQLIPTGKRPDGSVGAGIMDVETYIARVDGWFLENGFFEKEIHRVEERYGSIAHHFSTYESYKSASDAEPFARGINSFQLLHDGDRWWILNIFWEAETPQVPIPDKYGG